MNLSGLTSMLAGSISVITRSNHAAGLFPARLLRLLFTCAVLTIIGAPVVAQTNPPVLLSEASSTRAVALESVVFLQEPFAPNLPGWWGPDQRTRVMLFAMNLALQPGEDPSVVTADAEDESHHHYDLKVEYVGKVPGQDWMSSVILRLNDDLGDVGDVLVRITYHGMDSNRVRIGIGHVGGGPPDDSGAVPTPAPPPCIISGQVTSGAIGLQGVSIAWSGPQNGTLITDESGGYSFTVAIPGQYVVTPSKTYYDFNPPNQTFSHSGNDRISINFTAARQAYTIRGQAQDDNGRGVDGITMTLTGGDGTALSTAITSNGGNYTFASVPAGYNYMVAPTNTSVFTFTAQSINNLTGNLTLNFKGTRLTYTISGNVASSANCTSKADCISGITITLTGSQTGITTTDANGYYSFTNLAAGENYLITPSKTNHTFTPQNAGVDILSSNQMINFTGALVTYSISGTVNSRSASGTPASGVTLTLSGSATGTTTTDTNGNYSFNNLVVGGTYTMAPSHGNHAFDPLSQTFANLSSNQTANFIEIGYTISGQVTFGGIGLRGVSLALSDSTAETTITDGNGNYSFLNLKASGNYTVTPSFSNYAFAPSNQTFANLSSNETANFAIAYTIRGQVTAGGNGLDGIMVVLSGSAAQIAFTDAGGNYSFTAPARGSYTVTPSTQNYYTFNPTSQNYSSLNSDQAANFAATPTPISSPFNVLEFDGTPKAVDYGKFWPGYVALGHFFWEFWAMPGNNAGATYMVSDGYGGAHALLFGFANYGSSEPGRYQLFGDIWDGKQIIYFSSDEGPAPGEWGHFAVGWDGMNIITYFNGVPVGRMPFAGPRMTLGPDGGSGKLFIGGSGHNNLDGRIAQVRGYEDSNPREGIAEASFAPQTVFRSGGNFLTNFFQSGVEVADLSRGYNGSTHTGYLRNTENVIYDCPGCPPLPQYVIDQTAPNFADESNPAQSTVPVTPPPVPGGARIFDSFSRSNSTYALGATGGLGSTEGGAAGSRVWQTNQAASNPQPFGILNGRVVLLANNTSMAWVPTGSTTGNLDIRVDRHPGRWGSGMNTGISFRVLDNNNYFFAYTSDSGDGASGNQALSVGYYQAGARTDLAAGINVPNGWTTLQVVTTNAGSIAVYADGAPVYSTTSNIMTTATGAGLYNDGPGLGLTNRWDNFTVYDAP